MSGRLIASLILNAIAVAFGFAWIVGPGGHFIAPWDGPAVATLALTAAAIILGAVTLMAALLAMWGFATLREHAGSIARSAALEAMPRAAEAAAERVVKEWLGLSEGDSSNEIAAAYEREDHGN
jgi:uncharacterized membrane-anchored protein